MSNKGVVKFLAILTIIFILTLNQTFAKGQCLVTEYDQVATAVKDCTNILIDNLKVPGGQQLLLNLKSGTTLTFRGNTSFEHHEWFGPLVYLTGTNLTVRGEEGSVLDGQGSDYWDGCGTCTSKPRFFKMKVNNAVLEDINILNCPVLCILIRSSDNLIVRNWKIDNLQGDKGIVPVNKTGHNTDGFNVADVNNTIIENSVVYNQDDCVVVQSGKNITVRNMFCHGSHGLSVKGVGAVLEDVVFENSILTMGQNGIHVKAPLGGGPGLINNVTYRNITMLDTTRYGINVQQNYNSQVSKGIQGNESKDIPIYNLQMSNIFGNVQNGAVPVYIYCLQGEGGCFDWKWDEVNIYGANGANCTNYVPDGYDCQ